MLRFQSTFPRGERRFLRGGSRLVSYFNPRSLVGNDAIDIKFYVPKIDFNPRSLVGNDEQAEARQWQHAISIHVPSWGTTACTSIETGVDLFQSTFPRGERRQLRKILHKTKQISIHVPSWGTTTSYREYLSIDSFQSTFPRGERRSVVVYLPAINYFNPRSLVGNDGLPAMPKEIKRRFQSTFPRGERLKNIFNIDAGYNFNPRSLVGNDGKFSQIFFVFLCNKYNFSTFYYPFSLFFSVIHVTFLIFVVRILPAFYVYF